MFERKQQMTQQVIELGSDSSWHGQSLSDSLDSRIPLSPRAIS
jgi:hypothetical protein